MTTRYGIQWPDGSYTGGVTDKHDRVVAYLKEAGIGGRIYKVGSPQDPELKSPKTEATNAKPS